MDTISVILPNGDPNGVKIIKLDGWNGKCFILNRTELPSLRNRAEIKSSGLYFLFGEDKDSDEQLVYIGESKDCHYRLSSHDSDKDFWNEAVVFTEPPDRKYLESVATKLAKNVDRFIIKNGNQPQEEFQDEFDQIRNNNYFNGVKKILSTFGYKVFESVADSVADTKFYYLKADGVEARAQLIEDGSLNVLKGATARIRETEAFLGWSQNARKRFLEDGTIKDSGDGLSYIFTKDILFKSPSAAAATLTGRPINGWTAWKDEQGNTLDENLRK